jgi:hypothetical protein
MLARKCVSALSGHDSFWFRIDQLFVGRTPMSDDSIERLKRLAERAKKLDDVIQNAAK